IDHEGQSDSGKVLAAQDRLASRIGSKPDTFDLALVNTPFGPGQDGHGRATGLKLDHVAHLAVQHDCLYQQMPLPAAPNHCVLLPRGYGTLELQQNDVPRGQLQRLVRRYLSFFSFRFLTTILTLSSGAEERSLM